MTTLSGLPACLSQYLDAVNSHDPKAFLSSFAADAVVRDISREIRGHEAIAHWAANEIFAVNVTLEPLSCIAIKEAYVLTVKVDGTFDRTGLPDPLVMNHTLVLSKEKITSLTCRLANPDGTES